LKREKKPKQEGPFTNQEIGKILSGLWGHLTSRRQQQFAFLSVLMLFGGLTDAFSLGLVVPFLAALAAPDKVLDHVFFLQATDWLGKAVKPLGWLMPEFQSTQQSMVTLGAILFSLVALLAGCVRLLLLRSSIGLAEAVGTDIGLKIYERTLYQPLARHANRNSSRIISGLTTKISNVTTSFGGCLAILNSFFVLLFIGSALILVSPSWALAAAASLGAGYVIVVFCTQRKLSKNSAISNQAQNQLVQLLREGLGNIRDILLDGTQKFYCGLYQKADVDLRRAYASSIFMGQSPKFILEPIGMVFFAALALALAGDSKGLAQILPVMGGLALGIQRLLPAFQAAYNSWAAIVSQASASAEILHLLDQPLPKWADQPLPAPLPFKRKILFDRVSFRYFEESSWVLRDLSFGIAKGERIGFVGKTGSGKSTCLDLLMGLLVPTSGRILVDGRPLDEKNLRAWRQNISHVPQAIYLSDSSVAENIALGVPSEKIDPRRVREAAHQAQIAGFIESLPEGYETRVGERGILFSGGQRQRIGVARALYKKASVLVFDEATSALDQDTEKAVMASIHALSEELTVLIIAHRVTSLRFCSKIIQIKNVAKSRP